MINSSPYSKTDLALASSATVFTALSVLMAEFSLVSTVQEIITFVQEVYNAPQKYPNNSLIQAMTGIFHNSIQQHQSPEATVADADLEVVQSVETEVAGKDPATLMDFTADLLDKVFNGLGQKVSPSELQEFKQFLYNLAESIANAAGEGTLGTGTKVSPTEAQALARLKTILGI